MTSSHAEIPDPGSRPAGGGCTGFAFGARIQSNLPKNATGPKTNRPRIASHPAPPRNGRVSWAISAPSVTLSTLPAINSESFQGTTHAGSMIINGNLNATSGNVTLLGYQTTISGSVTRGAGPAKPKKSSFFGIVTTKK